MNLRISNCQDHKFRPGEKRDQLVAVTGEGILHSVPQAGNSIKPGRWHDYCKNRVKPSQDKVTELESEKEEYNTDKVKALLNYLFIGKGEKGEFRNWHCCEALGT
ncbi:MexE family multidrug efflux RND transporter periplasmic adaptor [Sesbania bispinosa]|nr:MexE family multidrug efflux RND transporter periplasmic adaptor [Sesbania bispinosa]